MKVRITRVALSGGGTCDWDEGWAQLLCYSTKKKEKKKEKKKGQ
jgi:hypothetical protein